MHRADAKERGAALVEFAMVLPLLLLLIFGIIEASWAFAQHNDIRYGAREGARLAAVQDTWAVSAIGQETCDRMDTVYPAQNPTVTINGIGTDSNIGGLAEITVVAPYTTLTGVLDGIFGSINLTSTIQFRIEQPTTGSTAWWGGSPYTCA